MRDAALLPRYRAAGVEHTYVGVESVNQVTLDMFKKDLKIEESKRAIELIGANDMISETSFVMGMPEQTAPEMDRTIELSKFYDADMAFFLAITPWPYADLYRDVAHRVVTRDYRKYNLIEPAVEPLAMTTDEVRAKLFEGFRTFYTHKMQQVPTMPEWKRVFMGKLMDLFMTHSYLKDQTALLRHPGQLPPAPGSVRAGE